MLRRIIKNKFIRSGAIYSLASFMVSIVGYLLNLIIARTFSLADYGEYMTAMAYVFFLSVPLGAFGLIIMKKVGAARVIERGTVAILLEDWLFVEFKKNWFLILILGLLFFGLVFFKGNMSWFSILFILIFSLLFIFFNFYSSVLQAYKKFIEAGVLLILVFSVRFIFSLGVVTFNPSLVWLFLVFILANLIGVLIGHKLIRKNNLPQKMVINFDSATTYLKRRRILIPLLTSLGLAGLINIDIILVKKFFPGELAGLYASISLLGKIVFYIAAPLTLVGFSFFTGRDSQSQAGKILFFLTIVIACLGLGSILFYFLFPSLIVSVIFGEKFLEVSDLVWLAAVFGALYSLITLYAQYFIAKNNRFGLLCLGGTLVQAIAIYFFHDNLNQILWVNIGVGSVLLGLLMGKVVLEKKQIV